MFALLLKRTALLTLIILPAFAANDNNVTYLALGDSIAFGYDPTVAAPSPDKFSGYPDVVAIFETAVPNAQINAACPGQTSASFIDLSVADYGCLGFRATIGLHTSYDGTQLRFAISQLKSNPKIKLVTLSIGGNDLVLLELQCQGTSDFAGCVTSGLQSVLPKYGQNLVTILSSIRGQAKYKGTLVLVNNYVPNADPLFTQAVGALNQVMAGVGSQFGAKMADSFTAFKFLSGPFNNDPCNAGLLVRLSATSCDVHPSKLGRNVIAGTVEVAIHTGN